MTTLDKLWLMTKASGMVALILIFVTLSLVLLGSIYDYLKANKWFYQVQNG